MEIKKEYKTPLPENQWWWTPKSMYQTPEEWEYCFRQRRGIARVYTVVPFILGLFTLLIPAEWGGPAFTIVLWFFSLLSLPFWIGYSMYYEEWFGHWNDPVDQLTLPSGEPPKVATTKHYVDKTNIERTPVAQQDFERKIDGRY